MAFSNLASSCLVFANLLPPVLSAIARLGHTQGSIGCQTPSAFLCTHTGGLTLIGYPHTQGGKHTPLLKSAFWHVHHTSDSGHPGSHVKIIVYNTNRGHMMGIQKQTGFMLPMLGTHRLPLSHVDRATRRNHLCFRVKYFSEGCMGLEILRKFMVNT